MQLKISGLLYDEEDPRCFKILSIAQGERFAFVQVIDLGTGNPKRYWGAWQPEDETSSLLEIMSFGGKWPNLPPAPEDLAL